MDKELQHIGWLIKLLDAFEGRMYLYCKGERESARIRSYIAHRYKYFFDWLNEKT